MQPRNQQIKAILKELTGYDDWKYSASKDPSYACFTGSEEDVQAIYATLSSVSKTLGKDLNFRKSADKKTLFFVNPDLSTLRLLLETTVAPEEKEEYSTLTGKEQAAILEKGNNKAIVDIALLLEPIMKDFFRKGKLTLNIIDTVDDIKSNFKVEVKDNIPYIAGSVTVRVDKGGLDIDYIKNVELSDPETNEIIPIKQLWELTNEFLFNVVADQVEVVLALLKVDSHFNSLKNKIINWVKDELLRAMQANVAECFSAPLKKYASIANLCEYNKLVKTPNFNSKVNLVFAAYEMSKKILNEAQRSLSLHSDDDDSRQSIGANQVVFFGNKPTAKPGSSKLGDHYCNIKLK